MRLARDLRTALIATFAIVWAHAGALPAEPGQRFAGATDGVWYWVLPDTPGGTRPIQSWSGAGAGPGGEISSPGWITPPTRPCTASAPVTRTPRGRRCTPGGRPLRLADGQELAPGRGRREVPHAADLVWLADLRREPKPLDPRRRLQAAARFSLVHVRHRRGLLQRSERERAGRGRRAAGRDRQHRHRQDPEPGLRRQPADRRPLRLRHRGR